MECQARLQRGEEERSNSYQSYLLRLVETREGELELVCESKASSFLRVPMKRGSLRRLVSDSVAEGRASVLFSDEEETSLAEVDIRQASPDQLRAFMTKLASCLPSSSTPGGGLKRRLNLTYSRRCVCMYASLSLSLSLSLHICTYNHVCV